MKSSSLRVPTIASVPEFCSPNASAATRIVHFSSPAGPLYAVVSISVELGAGPSSGAGDVVVGRSLTSLVSAFSTFSCPCAVSLSAGSIPGGASDSSAADATIVFRQ